MKRKTNDNTMTFDARAALLNALQAHNKGMDYDIITSEIMFAFDAKMGEPDETLHNKLVYMRDIGTMVQSAYVRRMRAKILSSVAPDPYDVMILDDVRDVATELYSILHYVMSAAINMQYAGFEIAVKF